MRVNSNGYLPRIVIEHSTRTWVVWYHYGKMTSVYVNIDQERPAASVIDVERPPKWTPLANPGSYARTNPTTSAECLGRLISLPGFSFGTCPTRCLHRLSSLPAGESGVLQEGEGHDAPCHGNHPLGTMVRTHPDPHYRNRPLCTTGRSGNPEDSTELATVVTR